MFCRYSVRISLQDFLGLPGPLLPSFRNQYNASCGLHLSSIWCTYPSHWWWLPLFPFQFFTLSPHCRFCLSMWLLCCHLWCAASNHFIFMTVVFHVPCVLAAEFYLFWEWAAYSKFWYPYSSWMWIPSLRTDEVDILLLIVITLSANIIKTNSINSYSDC